MSSPEQNYFLPYAMEYPVRKTAEKKHIGNITYQGPHLTDFLVDWSTKVHSCAKEKF